jgi:predicted RNA binding protein YcfA (HicA-like mRNA interferase family)
MGVVMTARMVIRILERNGWQAKKSSGGHRMFFHPGYPEKGKVTVPYHGGDIDRKTLESIARQTGLTF